MRIRRKGFLADLMSMGVCALGASVPCLASESELFLLDIPAISYKYKNVSLDVKPDSSTQTITNRTTKNEWRSSDLDLKLRHSFNSFGVHLNLIADSENRGGLSAFTFRLADSFELGAFFAIDRQSTTSKSGTTTIVELTAIKSEWSVGPFGRLVFPVSEKVGFETDLQVGLGLIAVQTEAVNSSSSDKKDKVVIDGTFYFGKFDPSIVVKLAKNFSYMGGFQLGYGTGSPTYKSTTGTTTNTAGAVSLSSLIVNVIPVSLRVVF